jgi:hypothetical protein
MTMAKETHPYNLRWRIPNQTQLLIVGTAPPPRFSNPACISNPACKCTRVLDFDFFYGSGDNYMWVFLENIAEKIDDRKLFADDADSAECCRVARAFLQRRKIWMRDILQTYQRKPNKQCSALDNDIIATSVDDCTDFRPILSACTSLIKIVFTSEKAVEWTFRKLEHQGLVPPGTYAKANLQKKVQKDASLEEYVTVKFKHPFWQGRIAGRDIDFFTLPSPTGRSPKKGLTKDRKQDIYKDILFPQ